MKNLAKSFLSYLLLLISFTTVAQVEYLKKDAQLESELSIKQKDQYAKLKNLKSFKSVDIVKVSSLKDLQKNGELKFSLPNYDKKLVAKALYVDAKDSENYKWHGEIFDKKDDLIGFMHIVVEDGNTSGLINTGGQEFHLVSFEDNKKGASFLLESDMEQMNLSTCKIHHDLNKKDTYLNSRNSCNSPSYLANVRILVLYTSAALATGISPSSVVNTGLSHLNAGYNNSLINRPATFTLAGIQHLSGFQEQSSYIESDLAILTTQADPIRSNYYADLVVLLTDGNYGNGLNGFAGYASINTNANPNAAYAIVEIENAASGTFAHEVAHLLGCDHQIGFSETSGNNRAHTWTTINGLQKTITAAPSAGSLPYFSNPAVTINGNASGLLSANNAFKVNQNICQVALFNETFSPYVVNISGPPYIYNTSAAFTWCPLSSGCSSLSNYTWSFSTDGFNFTTFSNATCGSKVGSTFPAHYRVFIKLTAKCNDNNLWASYTKTVTNWSYNNVSLDDEVESRNKSENINNEVLLEKIELSCSPNPFTEDNLKLEFLNPSSQIVKLDIVNNKGEIAKHWNLGLRDKGEIALQLDNLNLNPGIYYLVITLGNKLATRKLVVK